MLDIKRIKERPEKVRLGSGPRKSTVTKRWTGS